MGLWDPTMETLPEYLRGVKPRHLKLTCSKKLSESLSPGSPEWDKISHIRSHLELKRDPSVHLRL
ncbi:hypothetical protein EJB05_25666, partial [Eragrostis curvula]